MNTSDLDRTDLRLLHALQIEPRASWNQLAPIIGVGPGTLARRWERISTEGLAWITGLDTRGQLVLLEIDCDLLLSKTVAKQLSRDSRVEMLEFGSGARTLLALIAFDDLSAASRFLTLEVDTLDGVRAIRSHLLSETLIHDRDWRLHALEPAEADRIPLPASPRPRAATRVPDEIEGAIMRELWADGRAQVSDMSERTGIAPQRLADGIATLRGSGALALRTDIAREASDWPVNAWYFISTPGRTMLTVRRSIASIPQVRFAATSASWCNLIVSVGLSRISDLNRFEADLERVLPHATVGDRSVVLRTVKHMNQRIGAHSRASG